jgi:hypothetical protein
MYNHIYTQFNDVYIYITRYIQSHTYTYTQPFAKSVAVGVRRGYWRLCGWCGGGFGVELRGALSPLEDPGSVDGTSSVEK